MNAARVMCRNCEYVQPPAAICRRCERPLPQLQQVRAEPQPQPQRRILTLREIQRTAILARVERFGGDVEAAAQSLGISRRTMYRKLERFSVKTGTKNKEGACNQFPDIAT